MTAAARGTRGCGRGHQHPADPGRPHRTRSSSPALPLPRGSRPRGPPAVPPQRGSARESPLGLTRRRAHLASPPPRQEERAGGRTGGAARWRLAAPLPGARPAAPPRSAPLRPAAVAAAAAAAAAVGVRGAGALRSLPVWLSSPPPPPPQRRSA